MTTETLDRPTTEAAAPAAPREPVFVRADWLAALTGLLVSGAVYFYTAAPNVTLLDSGEFNVAAQHFGVPHPTGYPLWTLLTWLWTLLPIGNVAWEVNLFSGFTGALAVGVTTLLASSMVRWLWPSLARGDGESDQASAVGWCAPLVGVSTGLLFAFSFSVWTQAVIAEVYTLHCLLVGLFVAAMYWWVRRPERDLAIISVFFTFALAMSNHHLTLALAPLPLLIPLLLRRDAFWEVVTGALLSAALVYLGFAWLSQDETTWKTAVRFLYFALFALALLATAKKRGIDLRIVLLAPVVVVAGLLPYAYMPLASSTNPPMNWGYTSIPEGFFYSINRSQYSGSLSDLIVKTLGKAMGTAPEKGPEAQDPDRPSKLELGREFVVFYIARLGENFTAFGLLAFLAAALALLRVPLPQRTFLYILILGFVLAAFLQPLMEGTETTLDAWSLQYPYHGYAYLFFALAAAAGLALLLAVTADRWPPGRHAAWLLLLLPLWTLVRNEPVCSQRGHWFGWHYGHDMLKDLPKDAFVFGGTDPGRFVPTYMILGESFVDPRHRRDPGFDRRDLYIVTQNALADAFYQRYIRDHYGESRPAAKGWFEKWLGRDQQYPANPIKLPDDEQLAGIVRGVTENLPPGANPADPTIGILYHAAIAQWIFEQNKDRHEFFIEESFPMEWTYAHAVPHGLSYRLNKTPLEAIPPEEVEKDMRYWDDYVARLLADPNYHQDFDAKRSFSKLRNSTGNIYRYRRMWPEAAKAYGQALQLHPNNLEALIGFTEVLRQQKRWEEILAAWDLAVANDPSNRGLHKGRARVIRLRDLSGETAAFERQLEEDPGNADAVAALLRTYVELGEADKAKALMESSAARFGDNVDFLRFAVEFALGSGQWSLGLDPARNLVRLQPTNFQAWLALAKMEYGNRQTNAFLEAAREAVKIGGAQAKMILANDPMLRLLQATSPQFRELLQQ